MHRSLLPCALPWAALVTTALVVTATPAIAAPTNADPVVASAPPVGVPGQWSRTAPRDIETPGDLVFAPGDPSTAFFGIESGGLARTTDGGATWDHLGVANGLDGLSPATRVRVDPGDADRVVTAGNRGIYESVDGGDEFSLVEPGVAGTRVDTLELAAGPTAGETTGVAAVSSSSLGASILFSAVPGTDWVDRTGDAVAAGLGGVARKQLAVDPTDPRLVVVTDGTVVLRTTDITAPSPTWTSIRATTPGVTLRDLTVVGSTLVAVASDGHVYRSGDALDPEVTSPHWGDAGAPFGNSQGLFQAAPLGASGLLVGGTSGVAKTGNVTGATPAWGALGNLPGQYGVGTLAAADAAHLVIVQDGQVHGSLNGGTSFSTWGGVVNTTVVDLDAVDGHVVAPTYGGLVRSDDAGRTWRKLPQSGGIGAVALDPHDPDRVLVTTGAGVERSTDGGVTFTQLSTGLPEGAGVRELTWDPERPGVVWAALYTSGDSAYRSTDGGATFAPAGTGLPGNYYPTELVLAPGAGAVPDVVYAYGNGGVYATTNGGDSWVSQSEGLPGALNDLVADPADPAHLVGAVQGFPATLVESRNSGATWTPVEALSGAAGTTVTQLAYSPTGSRLVVAVADNVLSSRLVQSTDDLASFGPLTPAVPYSWYTTNDLAYDSQGLHVATRGAGIFDLTFTVDQRVAVSAPSRLVAGVPFAVTVRPTATGVTELSGVRTVVDAPAGVRVTSAATSAGPCQVTGRRVTCAQGRTLRTVTVRGVATATGRRAFTARVSADQVETAPASNTATRSVTVGKAAARLTARSTPGVDTRTPHTFVVTGTLARADRRALTCSGPVAVAAKNGSRTVQTRRATLTRSGTTCRFRAVLTWRTAPAGTLTVTASHPGTALLLPSRSTPVRVRLG